VFFGVALTAVTRQIRRISGHLGVHILWTTEAFPFAIALFVSRPSILHQLLDLLGRSRMDTGDLLFSFLVHMYFRRSHGDFLQKKAVYATMKMGSDMQPYEMIGFL
jgi:hypothetical protein